MKIKYDPEADAMSIKIRRGKFDHNKEIDEDVILDCDKEGNILSIEILSVTENNPHLLDKIKAKELIAV